MINHGLITRKRLSPSDVDDTPVNGATTVPASSNAVYDHAADLDAHTKNNQEIVRTGEYWINPGGATSNYGMVANTLYGRLLIIPRDMTFDRIAIHVKTAVESSHIRLGIYNVGTNLYPGTLLLDAGVVDSSAVGVKTIVIDQALTKGIYFLACVSDNTPSCYSDSRVTIGSPLGLYASGFSNPLVAWTVAQAYGALPDPFTAGGVLGENSLYYGWTIPLRVASLD